MTDCTGPRSAKLGDDRDGERQQGVTEGARPS